MVTATMRSSLASLKGQHYQVHTCRPARLQCTLHPRAAGTSLSYGSFTPYRNFFSKYRVPRGQEERGMPPILLERCTRLDLRKREEREKKKKCKMERIQCA